MLDKSRPKTPSDSSRPKTPTRPQPQQQQPPQQQPYMEMSAPSRPDFFPRYDSRRDFQRNNNLHHTDSDRWNYNNRDAKPGQFRSRTPGPEMMTRGGGPDHLSRADPHNRPKTPTAADMRTINGKPPGILSQQAQVDPRTDPRTSGRFTPNPSSEIGRQYRPPDYPSRAAAANHWPEFSSSQNNRRYDMFENPSLNRSYAGEFSRQPSGRPIRQSTSFESENPAPSAMTRLPRQPGQVSPRSQEEGELMESQVTLHRQESGYGFRIIGGTEEGSQVSDIFSSV